MKLEVHIPDELLSLMSEDEIKSKIEEFIKELSFEQNISKQEYEKYLKLLNKIEKEILEKL
jgi:hypothetical protein